MKNIESQFSALTPEAGGEKSKRKPPETPKPEKIAIGKPPYVIEKEDSVSYLGVEVPKGEGGPLVPDREEAAKYFYTREDYLLRREMATAIVLNKPMIFEGGTGIGKTSAMAAMCAELNTNYCKVSFGREMAIEDVIGGKTITTDENGNETVKWYDGNLLVAIRHGGIAFLDEYNLQGSKVGSRVNPIIDAILNGRKEISLPENDNEQVKVHPNFRVLAAQNPPGTEEGQEFTGREALSAETFGRWTFHKLPLKMSKEMRNQRLAGMMGEEVDVSVPEEEFRYLGEGVPLKELKDIPGMAHWRREAIDIIDQLETKSSGASREMARDQRQRLYFNPRLEQGFLNYVSKFYRGDVNEVWKNAFEHLVVGMYKSDTDKEKIRTVLNQASWKPPTVESKRKGLERGDPNIFELALPPEQVETILERNRVWQEEFFGKQFEMPPLPRAVTPERLKHWESLKYELRFLPRLTMNQGDTYPGWKKKPESGIKFFDELKNIQNLPENKSNPHLKGLAPNELPGVWTLMDTRAKPNFDNGNQQYEDDEVMQEMLKRMAKMKDAAGQSLLNGEAKDGLRNVIHPSVFQKSEFWNELKKFLQLENAADATARLPRLIEQNVTGQTANWDGTSTYEWSEEYYQSGKRLISGNSVHGGASRVGWGDGAVGIVGFRPLVVFSSEIGSLEPWELELWEKKKEELRDMESKILTGFFEKEIVVSPLPAEITPERLKKWEKLGFELHYFPAEDMTKDRKLKGWKEKPNDWFYEQIADGTIPSDATKLPDGWFVINGRQKPAYTDGTQMYDNDPLAAALKDLNERGIISQTMSDGKIKLNPASRFGMKPADFEKPEVIETLSKALNITPAQFSLTETIVWNVLANIHHPEWGTTNTYEWQKEKFGSGERLISGNSVHGGASYVYWLDDACVNVGFRPLGRFSP